MISSLATAETLVPGERYTGKKTLEVPALSIAFTLPSGWTGVTPSGTEWFHVGKDNDVGRVFVWASRTTEAEVRSVMAQGFTAGDAVTLSPLGSVRSEAGVLLGDFDASDGATTYKAHVRTRTENGIAVAFVAVAPPDKLEQFVTLARKMEKSLTFATKPKATAQGQGKWTQFLSGRRLARFRTNSGATGGYSEKEHYDLCPDGRFERKFRASSVSGAGDGVTSNREGGTWSVNGNQLTLRWSDGHVSQHALEDRDGRLYVDGQPWLLAGRGCQ